MNSVTAQIDIPGADGWDLRATASVNGRETVRGAENHDIVHDVAARPADYVVDEDAVRIEIFLLPVYWNEGHEDVTQPVLTYFVPTWANAVLVHHLVEAQRRTWLAPHPQSDSIDLEARTTPGSTKAKMTSPVDIVLAVAAWVATGRATQYIP